MVLNKDRQFFLKVVDAVIGFQGLVWVALSITGIVVYFQPPAKLNNEIGTYDRYVDYLSRIIYDEFMVGGRNRVIRPKDFAGFLWTYMFLSAIWVAVSIGHFTVVHYKNVRQSLVTLILGVTVLVTSIIDLVFISLLGRDFYTCTFSLTTVTATTVTTPSTLAPEDVIEDGVLSQYLSDPSLISLRNTVTTGGLPIDCQLANGIIMVVAARGYVLWILNVLMAIILITIGAKALRTPELQTYKKNTIPRARVPELKKQPSTNEMVFTNDMVFLGDDGFPPPSLPPQNGNRNRNSTPAANKNQAMYY